MGAMAIHHVALTVNDWDRSRGFYSKLSAALGCKPIIDAQGSPHQDPEGRVLVFAGNDFMYSIWEAKKEHRGNNFQFYNVGLHHLAFAAPSRAAVDSLHETLTAMGADVLDPPQEYPYVPGYYAVFFRDPDGMKLEYVHIPS
jgi:glyoxylase I family protein